MTIFLKLKKYKSEEIEKKYIHTYIQCTDKKKF